MSIEFWSNKDDLNVERKKLKYDLFNNEYKVCRIFLF